MKIKLLFLSFFLLAFSPAAFAQRVVVRPKKVVYTRKGKDVPQIKKHFDVTYPTFSGSISPAAKRKLENTVSYWRVFDVTLRQITDELWAYALYYKVNYNKSGVLDIALTEAGVGAYPDEATVVLVIDLKTGRRAEFADVFDAAQSKKMAALADKKLAIEKARIIREIDAGNFGETEEDRASDKRQISDLKFTTKDLKEFSVGDKGVTFIYDAGFPHVIQALEPEGKYFFSWAQLKPFIRRDGLLARFVR